MGLRENADQVAVNGNHLRITIKIARKVLHKDSGTAAVNHVIKRENTDSVIDRID